MRILFGLVMLEVSVTGYSQTPAQPFTLILSAFRSQVFAGAQIEISVVMTNSSDHQIDCTGAPSNGLDRNFKYDVLYEDGQEVPRRINKHPHVGPTGSIWPCVIKPGGTARNAGGLISALYDFSRPGEYKIQVERYTAFDPNSPTVKSNIITIRVLPADEPIPAQR